MDEEFESLQTNSYIQKEKAQRKNPCAFSGAEGETRTLAPVTRPTPLAGAPRHQLEYFSMVALNGTILFCGGDVGGEGGIRTRGPFGSPVFKTGSLNRSDTSPRL